MSAVWLQKKLQRGKEAIERYLSKNGDKRSAPAYELQKPATYELSRAIFLQLMGLTYLIALGSLFIQFEGLFGAQGLAPVADQLTRSRRLAWFEYPTLVTLHAFLGVDAYALCNALAVAGMLLASLATAGYGCAPVMFGCWVIYLSFTTVGETFLYFQWDSLLCEVGFLAFLYAPLLGRPSQSTTTSRVVLWMLRFLLFKFVLMSGVVKVASNDRSWLDLTALEYQLASQAIPTPAAWYARQLHPLLLQLFVAATFVIEIPIGILILCPFRMVRHAVAACLMCLQVLSFVSGNYGFFNLLALVLTIPLVDDSVWAGVLAVEGGGSARRHGKGGEETPLLTPGTGARGSGPVWGGAVRGGMGFEGGGSFGVGHVSGAYGPGQMGGGFGGVRMGGGGGGYSSAGVGGSNYYNGGMGGGGGGIGLSGSSYYNGPGGEGEGSMGFVSPSVAMGLGGGIGRRGGGGATGQSSGGVGQGGSFTGAVGHGQPQGEATLVLQALLGQSKVVQAAGTVLGLVNSVDTSLFWSTLTARALALGVAMVACFSMFRVDFGGGGRQPTSVSVSGAGIEWINGEYSASRVWRDSVQYKKDGGPLLRLYRTSVKGHPTWVLGAHDEAVYFARGSGSYPPSTNWQSASAAADPPPSVEPFWATASHSLPLSDRIRLRLAFDASDITGVMSGLLPSIVVVFSIGLSITAGIDLSTSLVYGVLATRRALSSTIDRGSIYARVIRCWMPLCWVCFISSMAVLILLAHVHALSEIAPSLHTTLLQVTHQSSFPLLRHRRPSVLGSHGGYEPRRSLLREGFDGAGGMQVRDDDASDLVGGGLSRWSFDLLEPFSISNGYGLFRSVTGVGPMVLDPSGRQVPKVVRPELIIEVSNSDNCDAANTQSSGQDREDDESEVKCVWTPYEFRYKPGNVARAPPWVAPHQPRIDWHMWFAALEYDWRSTSWFPSFLQKLALNQSSAVDLVGREGIPFKEELPKYIRVRKVLYDFTMRFQTTKVLYEAPQESQGGDFNEKRCERHKTSVGCDSEGGHCRFVLRGNKGNICFEATRVQHTLVTEESPDWWKRREPSLYSPVLSLRDFSQKGYLPEGHSLPNMPITFQGKYIGKPGPLRDACQAACKEYLECLGYTYQPSIGHCFLKSVSSPVRGLDCQGDACWYFGLVDEHVLIKHAFLGPASRVWIVKAAAAASILLLVARAGVFREGAGREWDKEGIAKLIGDLRSVLPGAALLLLLLALVYYTAHHMGQVFIPFLLAAGSGMMLSCYLYHVETNIEQSPRYAPACDINSVITCSTVANSRFSKLLFGCPNSLIAILFYFSLIGLSLSFELAPDSYWILLLTSAVIVTGTALSLYLQYISLHTLRVVCPVCFATCIINISLLMLAVYITQMQRAFLEYDDAFIYAMQHSTKHTHGDR